MLIINKIIEVIRENEAAIDAILINKFRSFLTTLGVIFGVASVICMMAIGNGAQKEILNQIESIGAKTIIIQNQNINITDNEETDEMKSENSLLSVNEANILKNHIQSINLISPFCEEKALFSFKNRSCTGTCIGVENDFFDILNLTITGRTFHSLNIKYNHPVCIISHELKSKLYYDKNPINQLIRIDGIYFKIIGVSSVYTNKVSESNQTDNKQVFIPFGVFKRRLVLHSNNKNKSSYSDTEIQIKRNSDRKSVDKIFIQVGAVKELVVTAGLIKNMVKKIVRSDDFSIIVPLQILKQHQESKKIFSIVLGVIAGISLLIGGIGIMNIMLASVYERIKEIGIRMAVGASPFNIQAQFLIESTLICFVGGVIGIILGVLSSIIIGSFTEIKTVISVYSVFLSFTIAITTGILFGFFPAKKASLQNPVESLRNG